MKTLDVCKPYDNAYFFPNPWSRLIWKIMIDEEMFCLYYWIETQSIIQQRVKVVQCLTTLAHTYKTFTEDSSWPICRRFPCTLGILPIFCSISNYSKSMFESRTQYTDSTKINRPGYNIRMYWINFWQPSVHIQKNIFEKR